MALRVGELYLVDVNGMANPVQVQALLQKTRPMMGDKPIVVHFHDTLRSGLASVSIFLQSGVTPLGTSYAGLSGCPLVVGGAGNIATEDNVNMMYEKGIQAGVGVAKVSEIVSEKGKLRKEKLGKIRCLITRI